MKQKPAQLQADILHTRRYHGGMGDDEELTAWVVLRHLEELVDVLAELYGKPEEADEG